MTDVVIMLNHISGRCAEAMFAVVWQSTLLACTVAIVLLAWRRPSPTVRCWIWRLVAIKILVMPFWAVAVPQPRWMIASSVPVSQDRTADVAAPPPMSQGFETEHPSRSAEPATAATVNVAAQATWQTWLVTLWLSVIVIQVVRLAWQHWRLQRLLSESPLADERICSLLEECSRQLPLSNSPEARVTTADVSPFICGMARPVLVLPASLVNSADSSQLRQIVLHELAHVRRHDLAWCWIAHVMRMIYWFHPVAHWVAFREALERELACDEMAMAESGATAADYARTLVEAAGRMAMPAALRAATAAGLDGGFSIR